uniref:Uncharacterized protein n=1 Tax=Arion vulgaris TaxID=1028688 RepID=A0A0B7C2E5_9EUPU
MFNNFPSLQSIFTQRVNHRKAIANWQKAMKMNNAPPNLFLLLKQDRNEKMGQFKTIANKAKVLKREEFCKMVANEKSFERFWQFHKATSNSSKSKDIPTTCWTGDIGGYLVSMSMAQLQNT